MNKNFESQYSQKSGFLTQKIKHNASAIAIVISAIIIVSLVPTLITSLSAKAPLDTTTEPQQFSLNLVYAYVGEGPENDSFTDSEGNTLPAVSQYPSAVYFNVTRSFAENMDCDAIIEVYAVKLASNKGPCENFIYFAGTNFKQSFSETELQILTEGIYNLFDINYVDAVTGNFYFNLTVNDSFLSAKIGSAGVYTNYLNGQGLWSEGRPNSLSITFNRIGYVTINNEVISLHLDASVNNRTMVQLQNHNDGFLKNEIIPIDELSQRNQFQPIK